MKLRNRHRLKRKNAKKVLLELAGLGFEWEVEPVVEMATGEHFEMLYIEGTPWAFELEGIRFPALRALLVQSPETNRVTVDMGAVKFLANGADVMSPGIVAAANGIKKGDVVWVGEEKFGRPLAVGIALISGPEMVVAKKGRAVKTKHFISDEIWEIDD